MTAEVSQAIEEIKKTFPDKKVEVEEESQGGAYVTVYDLDIGPKYTPSATWVSFIIGFQYPAADVYPHYLDNSVKRVDGAGFGSGLTRTSWRDKAVVQISRRSNRLNPLVDTATTKLLKVLEWLKNQ